MAAYAALVSVMNIIETIHNHPRPPISFDKDQLQSLTQNITFLQDFLETHSVDDDDLESRIADAAYAAEDVIESHIVDQIQANIIDNGETISSSDSEEFLETHSIDNDSLESRIADAAYAAEDVTESDIVDQRDESRNYFWGKRGVRFVVKKLFTNILKRKKNSSRKGFSGEGGAAAHPAPPLDPSHQIEASKTISSSDFHDGLHKVIQDFYNVSLYLIQRDGTSFGKKAGTMDDDDDQLLHNNYSLRRSHSSMGQDTSVGLDDAVVEVMNKLTWNQSNRQIIPIVGMGGIEEPIPDGFLLENLIFPRSLKELALYGTKLDWGDLGTKIGSLPHLQVLYLMGSSCVGEEWETVEGQFRSLKYLLIHEHIDLIYWRTESWTHFPCLDHLSLRGLFKLKEIPSEIGETLKSIEMWWCSNSAIFSAKEILNEQEGLGNQGLQVNIKISRNNPDVERLAAPNFQVINVLGE